MYKQCNSLNHDDNSDENGFFATLMNLRNFSKKFFKHRDVKRNIVVTVEVITQIIIVCSYIPFFLFQVQLNSVDPNYVFSSRVY